MARMSRLYLCLLVALLALPCVARAEIAVAPPSEGEVLRYPVALIQGTAEGADTVTVSVRGHDEGDGTFEAATEGGRFKALVRLVPGENTVDLLAGEETASLTLTYAAATNPYHVTVVYLTGSEGETAYPTQVDDDPQDYVAKLRTAAELMQTFTAEAMVSLGLGRQTFSLERDDDGLVIVHTVALPDTAEVLRSRDPGDQWQQTYQFLGERLDFATTKVLAMNGFIVVDPEKGAIGHTALGGGAQAVFSSNSICAWPSTLADVPRAFGDATPVDPTRVADDTAFRGTMWSLAATGIGAWLHELGHTLGLPHASDGRCIMSRGFDRFNRAFILREPRSNRNEESIAFAADDTAYWCPAFAERLQVSPWFASDGPEEPTTEAPSLVIDWERNSLIGTIPAGLATGQVELPSGEIRIVGDLPKGVTSFRIERDDLRRWADAPDGATLVLIDRHGREVRLDEGQAQDPR